MSRRAVAEPLQPVEQEVEPELELGLVIRIPGLEVLVHMLDEMRHLVSRLGRQPAIPYLAVPSRDDLAVLAGMVEAGTLRPVIDRSFHFAQIPDAIRYLESGQATGKVVISF